MCENGGPKNAMAITTQELGSQCNSAGFTNAGSLVAGRPSSVLFFPRVCDNTYCNYDEREKMDPFPK